MAHSTFFLYICKSIIVQIAIVNPENSSYLAVEIKVGVLYKNVLKDISPLYYLAKKSVKSNINFIALSSERIIIELIN